MQCETCRIEVELVGTAPFYRCRTCGNLHEGADE